MVDFEKGIKGIKKIFALEYQGEDMDYSVDFIGVSPDDCRNKLTRWLNNEIPLTIRNVKKMDNDVNTETVTNVEAPAVVATVGVSEAPKPKSNRGQHFIGTTWVVNSTLKDKKRVPVSELEDYLTKGYVKGGPRSKFT